MDKIKYNNKLYFISIDKINNNILYPRIPNNYFTKNAYEDNKQERICLCKNINKCLMALSKNCKDLTFNVYEVDDINKYQVYRPSIEEVPDSIITEELWIITPVKLKYIKPFKIKINKAIINIKNNCF